MCIGLYVKCVLFLSGFDETGILPTVFSQNTQNIKFHENPSGGSRVVPCGRTDMTKANSRFSQFWRKRPKNWAQLKT